MISKSKNKPLFKINFALFSILWFILLKLAARSQISIILFLQYFWVGLLFKVETDYIVVFTPPFFLTILKCIFSLDIVCILEIWTAIISQVACKVPHIPYLGSSCWLWLYESYAWLKLSFPFSWLAYCGHIKHMGDIFAIVIELISFYSLEEYRQHWMILPTTKNKSFNLKFVSNKNLFKSSNFF